MSAARGPRWIIFDAVGTLIFADPPVHLVYHRIGSAHGSRLSAGEVRTRFRSAFSSRTGATADGAPRKTSESEERRFWRAVVADVFPDVSDVTACFGELFEHFASATAWQCFADVAETVPIFQSRGFRLAIASNFDGRLHRVCRGLEELTAFEKVIVSSEVGYAKPARQFFDSLLEQCGCSRDSVVFVGDDAVADIAGARQSGLEAVHLDRTGRQGDQVIQTLTELPALLSGS